MGNKCYGILFLAPNYNTMDRLGKKPYSLERQGMKPALNQMGQFVGTASKLGLLATLIYFIYKRFSSGQWRKWNTSGCADTTHTVL